MKTNPLHRILAAALPLTTLAACFGRPDPTLGTEGQLSFEYRGECSSERSLDCLLAVGAGETVTAKTVRPYPSEGVHPASTDPRIFEVVEAQVDCHCERDSGGKRESVYVYDGSYGCNDGYDLRCDAGIGVRGVGEGEAWLVVRDNAGELVDQVLLRVREPKSAELRVYTDDSPFRHRGLHGRSGGEIELDVEFRDARGHTLLTTEGISWTSDDPSIVGVAESSSWFDFGGGSSATVELRQPGSTSIHASLASVSISQPVTVDP